MKASFPFSGLLLSSLIVVVRSYSYMDERIFKRSVEKTLDNLEAILNTTRSVQRADQQMHDYEDKYALVEILTISAWQTIADNFQAIGFLNLTEVKEKYDGSNIFLDMKRSTDCEFLKEVEVPVTRKVTRSVEGEGTITINGETESHEGYATRTYKTTHYTTEYEWKITEMYEIDLCVDSCSETANRKRLLDRIMSTTVQISTTAKPKVCPQESHKDPVNISWLLNHLRIQDGFQFSIDRNVASCRTPRRNQDIETVFKNNAQLYEWLGQLVQHLRTIYIPPAFPRSNFFLDLDSMLESSWSSAVPLLEKSKVLSPDRLEFLRQKERDDFLEKISRAKKLGGTKCSEKLMLCSAEALLYLFAKVSRFALILHQESVDFVENMLRDQLIQAIGKEIHQRDFVQYMNFHAKRLLRDEFIPKPFSIPVQHNSSTPVGSFTIEKSSPHGGSEALQILKKRIPGNQSPPILIPLDAATKVQITGDRILTGWIRYEFDSNDMSTQETVTLRARARQFSSVILLVGTVTGPQGFDAKAGIILKNKDEVLIPILTQTLPSAKEFKDAISSLSPEQRSFARAFRTMQLASSVFGVCVIQLKPQLELLLNLNPGSLAKEIQLTEDLTNLFVDHHIPADLLSFDGNERISAGDKVNQVKNHVAAVNDIILGIKKQTLHDETMKNAARNMSSSPSSVPSPSPSSSPSSSPSASPSASPSVFPNDKPSFSSESPSSSPSASPSSLPSSSPSAVPSASPSSFPTAVPTGTPTGSPTSVPTGTPTGSPTGVPTSTTTGSPTSAPIVSHTASSSDNSESTSSNTADTKKQMASHGEKDIPEKTHLVDFTKIPAELDFLIEMHDKDGYLRSMTIKASDQWIVKKKPNMLMQFLLLWGPIRFAPKSDVHLIYSTQ